MYWSMSAAPVLHGSLSLPSQLSDRPGPTPSPGGRGVGRLLLGILGSGYEGGRAIAGSGRWPGGVSPGSQATSAELRADPATSDPGCPGPPSARADLSRVDRHRGGPRSAGACASRVVREDRSDACGALSDAEPTRRFHPACVPVNCTTISRCRGRLSKSTRTICCQVPRISRPSWNGTVRSHPTTAERTWEWPLPSCQVSS